MIFHNIKYALVSAGIFLTDFCIKNHIEETKTEGTVEEAAHGRLLLRNYHNRGAFLDAGEKHSALVAAVSLALTLAMTVVFFLTFGTKGGSLLKTGLALLLGGAYSNTYDRLRRHYVVDYISFPVKKGFLAKKIRNVVFNISDFCIAIGALCMVLAQWKQDFKL
jgi:signal peptidase II